jgi:hypothetical protein
MDPSNADEPTARIFPFASPAYRHEKLHHESEPNKPLNRVVLTGYRHDNGWNIFDSFCKRNVNVAEGWASLACQHSGPKDNSGTTPYTFKGHFFRFLPHCPPFPVLKLRGLDVDGWDTFIYIRCGRRCTCCRPVISHCALHKYHVSMGWFIAMLHSYPILMNLASKSYNSLGQSPCEMTSWIGGVCNAGGEQMLQCRNTLI